MRLFAWLPNLFRKPPPGAVPFFDVEAKRVVQIPSAELRPGVIQARIEGQPGLVWVDPAQLHAGEVRHPEFSDDVREVIRAIQHTFAEHYPISFEEWEMGFRRDGHPVNEIGLWLRAAEIYSDFTSHETSAARREDVYRCLTTCLNTTREDVWRVLRPKVLSRAEAEQIVARYYAPRGRH